MAPNIFASSFTTCSLSSLSLLCRDRGKEEHRERNDARNLAVFYGETQQLIYMNYTGNIFTNTQRQTFFLGVSVVVEWRRRSKDKGRQEERREDEKGKALRRENKQGKIKMKRARVRQRMSKHVREKKRVVCGGEILSQLLF